jgi:phosphatidylserine decarboxylase
MWAYIKTLPQYILPQHLLSRCMYRIARWRWAPWKEFIIRIFIRHYQVDMQIAEQADPRSYTSFSEFFTRSLLRTERPIDDNAVSIVSPVDGSISQIGDIDEDAILQAKGKHFSLRALLANDTNSVERFTFGNFATIYLSPRDYHRIHLPLTASLIKMIYVPGDLFSVNEATSRNVDQLFARNERVICLFETEFGLMAEILVGAIFVGGMETVWQGEITPARPRELRVWEYDPACDTQTVFAKGEEMGHFNMGSTVILLFEQNRMNWSTALQAGAKVQMGQLIGTGNS